MLRDNVFGISFAQFTIFELAEKILEGGCNGSIIATPNVDHVVRFHNSQRFKNIYGEIDYLVNDSRILRLLSSLGMTNKITSLVPGSDLTKTLFDQATFGARFCVIGSAEKTINVVRKKYPNVKIDHYNPPMGFISSEAEVEKCMRFVNESPSSVTFFAVGSPRQEELALKVKGAGTSSALLCIGASILFLSGEEKRAPKILQHLHLEWLFRLLSDPKRLARRYIIDGPKILKIFALEVFNNKRN
jgi:N-acetylglucosaminyldiphosphoundecaprenol N-acetyl-beta-D-mannosaminyltransferase